MKERASSHHFPRGPKLGIGVLEKEVAALYLPLGEEDNHHQKARDVSEPPKPFAAFGSFRQRHGDAYECTNIRTIEAPAKLESSVCDRRGGLSQSVAAEGNVHLENLIPAPADCVHTTSKPVHPLRKFLNKGKSFSTDLDREEAWERKKEQYLHEEEEDCDDDEEYDADEGFYDAMFEHVSEDVSSSESNGGGTRHDDDDDDKDSDKHIVEHCNMDDVGLVEEQHSQAMHYNGIKKASRRMQSFKKKPFLQSSLKPLRTKSLTDEDLEELRGSIDLGFGFSYSERSNLKSTLPALELYYAINKNYVDAQLRSSPVSPLEGNALLRTNSAGSTSSPSNESWRISSPGDHPSQVKTRLRHWAQAVACSVKQGY